MARNGVGYGSVDVFLPGGDANRYGKYRLSDKFKSCSFSKEKVNQAFKEAATELGLGADQTEAVIKLIMTLAEKLSHIEALREQFQSVHMINDKIIKLKKTYGNEISVMEILNPVARLLIIAIKEYQDLFDQVDAKTG